MKYLIAVLAICLTINSLDDRRHHKKGDELERLAKTHHEMIRRFDRTLDDMHRFEQGQIALYTSYTEILHALQGMTEEGLLGGSTTHNG